MASSDDSVETGDRATPRYTPNGGSRPVPDPTELTDRALARLEKSLTAYIDGQLHQRDERLRGIDEATKLRVAPIDSIPDMIDEKVSHLVDLTTERFQAAERLRVEQKKDTKDAVDAALSAAKEAVKEQTTASERSIGKSEAATASQLKQQQDTFTASIEGLRRSIDELKDRETEDVRNLRQSISDVATTANTISATKVGSTENRTATYAVIGVLGTVIAIGVGILSFVLANTP